MGRTRTGRAGAAWLLAGALIAVSGATTAGSAETPQTVDVWPGKAPGEMGQPGPERYLEQNPNQKQVKRLTDVSHPTLTLFRPPADRDTGASVVIAPGGGYSILAWDLEGEEVAQWLSSIGVTGILLKYRVPKRPGQPADMPPVGPLQDAQRAISLVRSKAKEWRLDPQRIGMLGFSAGGHLTAATATNADQRAYEPVDAADRESCRPDFAVLVYPAYLVAKDSDQLAPEIRVTKDTPPCFFAHAHDDPISPENSVRMYLALKRAGVPSELHVYTDGGHGFGLRPEKSASSTWPKRCEEWMRARGLLERAGSAGK